MIVLDASSVVELVLRLPGGDAVARRLDQAESSLHAPHLLPLEVVQTIRCLSALRLITPDLAAAALVDVADLDVVLYEHNDLLPRIWDLRHNLTAYDASYVALAEVLDAPLLTFDARLAAAPGHLATIELLSAA